MKNQQYEEWDQLRVEEEELASLDDFSSSFLDGFFPQKMRKEKAEKFMNLGQGMMIVKGYALKFHQLYRYASELVSSVRARISKFTSRFFYDLVLNKYMDISKLVVYKQQVQKDKKKQVEMSERRNKKFLYRIRIEVSSRVVKTVENSQRKSRKILVPTLRLVLLIQRCWVIIIFRIVLVPRHKVPMSGQQGPLRSISSSLQIFWIV